MKIFNINYNMTSRVGNVQSNGNILSKGDSGVNKIVVSFDEPQTDACYMVVKRYDGATTNNLYMTPDFANQNYYIVFQEWMTGVAGDLEITVKLVGDTEQTFGKVYLEVYDSLTESDETITDAQYQGLLQSLNDHIGKTNNPHVTNAENAEYESGVSIKQKIDSDKQELDDHVSDKENPHEVTAEQVDTYNKATIDNKDANTLQAAKDYTYSKVEIDNKDTVIMNKANNLENANMFKDVSYNNVNGVLTFTRYDDTTKQIDLPLELLVESGYYDEITNELVLVLANGSEIRIPVGNLLTDLDAHNIRFNGSGTNYLVNKNDVESAVKELDTRVALKVSTSDIVDNLNSNDTDKPLSANQGKVLNDTTAKLAVSNVFTQPQQVPNATLPQHTVNKLQVETMFEMFKRQFRGYNLAMPDLTTATDLGGGVYRLYDNNGITIDYNVNNGIWTFNGEATKNILMALSNYNTIGQLTGQMIYIDGTEMNTLSGGWRFANNGVSGRIYWNGSNGGFIKTQEKNVIDNNLDFYLEQGSIFNNYQFKLKLEKGDTATPYTVPGQIPQYKIVGEE